MLSRVRDFLSREKKTRKIPPSCHGDGCPVKLQFARVFNEPRASDPFENNARREHYAL